MEPYVLFPVASRSGLEEGQVFHTLRRTRWGFTLRISSLESGGSVTPILEASPTAEDEDSWGTLYTFGAVSAEGTTTVYTYKTDDAAAAFTMTEQDLFIRGNLTANTGAYVLELLASSRFWDPDVELHREELTPILRESKVQQPRFMERAERDVIHYLQEGIDPSSGALNVDTDLHDTNIIIRLAIVEQGDWLANREVLASSKDAEDRREAVRRRGLSPAAEEMLEPVINYFGRVWRGR